jgi:uncharacterized protein DUF5655
MSLDDYFATGSPLERAIFDAIEEQLAWIGDVRIEPVAVGILLKRSRTFAELRPMVGRVRLSILMSRRLDHPRVTKLLHASGDRWAAFIDFRSAAEVDDEVRDWLTESYLTSPT